MAMLLSACCHKTEREGGGGEGERGVRSQQAVDGSLVSLHCWLVDFEDTLGNSVDSTCRHRRRQPTPTKHSVVTIDGTLAAAIPHSKGEDVRCGGGPRHGRMKWGDKGWRSDRRAECVNDRD